MVFWVRFLELPLGSDLPQRVRKMRKANGRKTALVGVEVLVPIPIERRMTKEGIIREAEIVASQRFSVVGNTGRIRGETQR